MGDTFTVYRQQPTPKALEKLASGEYVDNRGRGSSKTLYPTKNTGKWWSPHTNKVKLYQGQLYDAKTAKLVNNTTEILKGKINIDQWIKGWKEALTERFGDSKPPKSFLQQIDREAKEMKKLYKADKARFLKSLSFSQEAILDSVDNARTSIRQTFRVNPQRALVKGAEYLGKGAAYVGSGVAGPAAFFLGTKKVGDAELPFPEKRNKKPKGYSNVKGYSNAPRKAQTYG